ncbi:MAG: hypothetical protein ACPIOQ_23790 [Promethearchaeia archaeon]
MITGEEAKHSKRHVGEDCWGPLRACARAKEGWAGVPFKIQLQAGAIMSTLMVVAPAPGPAQTLTSGLCYVVLLH